MSTSDSPIEINEIVFSASGSHLPLSSISANTLSPTLNIPITVSNPLPTTIPNSTSVTVELDPVPTVYTIHTICAQYPVASPPIAALATIVPPVFRIPLVPITRRDNPVVVPHAAGPRIMPNVRRVLFARPPNSYGSSNLDSRMVSPTHVAHAKARHEQLHDPTQAPRLQHGPAVVAALLRGREMAATAAARLLPHPVEENLDEDDPAAETDGGLLGAGGSAKVSRIIRKDKVDIARKKFPLAYLLDFRHEVDNLQNLKGIYRPPAIYPAELMSFIVR